MEKWGDPAHAVWAIAPRTKAPLPSHGRTMPRVTLLRRPLAFGALLVAVATSSDAVGQNPLRQSTANPLQPVQQVGFFEDYSGGCGPVCGCETCVREEGCGAEEIMGFEPGCGFDGNGGGIVGGGGDCGGCGSCDSCSHEFDSLPIFLPILRPVWSRFDFFAGAQGYRGPMNSAPTAANTRGDSGSFGFYQGFNEGRSLRRLFGWDMAGQFGLRATQSNLAGSEFTDQTRHQIFLTGGLFRRVDYGLQYGMVVDYLNDDWYFSGNLVQLRGELSWKAAAAHEFGFQFITGVSDDTSTTVTRTSAGTTFSSQVALEPTDQYRAFYRQQLQNSGHWDVFLGGTNHSDTVIGTTMSLPVRRRLLVQAGATYLIPSGGNAEPKFEQESWNVSLGLVFRPGGPTGSGRYSRPMFDVADNGTFMVDRRN